MKIGWAILGFVFCIPLSTHAQTPKSLFYMTREPNSVRSFLAHADKIDTLVPAWYLVDANGLVSGGPNPMVMDAARQHHVPVMPLVANAGFVQDDFHKLLMNPAGYREMFSQLVRACNGFGLHRNSIRFRKCDLDRSRGLLSDGRGSRSRLP